MRPAGKITELEWTPLALLMQIHGWRLTNKPTDKELMDLCDAVRACLEREAPADLAELERVVTNG